MKSLITGLAIVFLTITSTSANAHTSKTTNANCNFIPKNDLNIPVGQNLFGGIDESAFNRVIDNVSSFYAPIMKQLGGTLKVNRLWTDGTVNASAERQGKTWILNMYGGLARHQDINEDGFALVMCHETGHHLGGYPRFGKAVGGSRSSWAANEGQADYFATMKCYRRVFENADNASVISGMNIPEIVKNQCSAQLKSQKEIDLCERSSMAGMTLATLLWDLSNGGKIASSSHQPAFDTPDTSVVSTTNDAHPAAQCRLDTYFNGSVCGVSFTQDFGSKDAITGACAEEKGDKLGFRPECWYHPITKN